MCVDQSEENADKRFTEKCSKHKSVNLPKKGVRGQQLKKQKAEL